MENKCLACGLCCKLFLINLSQKEYDSGKYKTVFDDIAFEKNYKKAVRNGFNILAQKEDGSCLYLYGKFCQIHKTRPAVCRKFFCSSKNKKFKGMIEIINKAQKTEISK